MDQTIKNNCTQTCPQCDNHCPVTALRCGRGHAYFGVVGSDESHDHHHGRGGRGHHDHDPCRCQHGPHKEWNDLAEKVERCGRLVSRCLGDRRGQSRILRALCQRGEMPQKELQEQLGIQAGSMSEIASKLEGKGFVVRVRSEEDRRKVSLSITQSGRDWIAQLDDTAIRHNRAELFSVLTSDEQTALEALLDKLSDDWTRRLELCGLNDPDEQDSCKPNK